MFCSSFPLGPPGKQLLKEMKFLFILKVTKFKVSFIYKAAATDNFLPIFNNRHTTTYSAKFVIVFSPFNKFGID